MPLTKTLTLPAPSLSKKNREESPADAVLWCLAPTLAQAVEETAGAFFAAQAVLGADLSAIPTLPASGILHCSQKNLGETHEMSYDLAVEKTEWDRLFTRGESDEFKVDALCELANCICGSVMADPSFTDEFGYLIPCVPRAGASLPNSDARFQNGAFRLAGVWIHYSMAISGHLAGKALRASQLTA